MNSIERPFLWGVANSSFQVEGFPCESDWQQWTHLAGKISDQTNADQATEFWNRFPEDILLAKNLGANAFRFSIAWERIEPSEGNFDSLALERYQTIIAQIKDAGMEPIVTLHHFVLPLWLSQKGGVLASDFPELFSRYAHHSVQVLGASRLVKNWITFNEPNVLVRSSFVEGEWPPGLKNDFKHAGLAAFNLAKAHLLAVNEMRADPHFPADYHFGIAIHWRVFEPKSNSLLDRMASSIADWFFNQQITRACLTGKIKIWFPGSKYYSEKVALKNRNKSYPGMDFLGVNYYGRSVIQFTAQPPFILAEEGSSGPTSDLGWEIYPSGLTKALHQTFKLYGLPLIITENGLADRDDSKRSAFLEDHLTALMEAKNQGVKVEGYLHWSLTDNFEWAHGFGPRFGLVAIDYETQKRTPRPSYFTYQKLIRKHSPTESIRD